MRWFQGLLAGNSLAPCKLALAPRSGTPLLAALAAETETRLQAQVRKRLQQTPLPIFRPVRTIAVAFNWYFMFIGLLLAFLVMYADR